MIKALGAVVIIAGCGGFGFSLSAGVKRETNMLRRLISALQEMEWELKYRMSSLSELCRLAGDAAGGNIREIFLEMAGKLDRREVCDISASFLSEVNNRDLPRRIRRNLKQLGQCLGRYDLEGQLQGLEAVRQQCRKDLKELESNSVQRLRSYQTLALCAGFALAILLL